MSLNPQHPLLTALQNWGADISTEFERAPNKGGRSPSDVASFRENVIEKLLISYFPFPYRVTKGVIRDLNGNESASVDKIILAPNHPYTVHNEKDASLILADGVEAAIEVKSNPQSKQEIVSAIKQSSKTKKLRRVSDTILLMDIKKFKDEFNFSEDQISELRDYCKEIPYFVFYMKTDIDLQKSIENIMSEIKVHHIREVPDCIILNGKGLLITSKFSRAWGYSSKGFYFEHWEENTIAGFLLLLNQVHPTQMRLSEPILPKYLQQCRDVVQKYKVGEGGTLIDI